MMKTRWMLTAALATCAMFVSLAAHAQEAYPTKPVRIVVGFAAGGLNDVLARLIAAQLGPALGQPVVVENRPGAAANLAAEHVARAEPDGHTLLLSSSALAINPALNPKLSYDPIKDLAPIIQITSTKMLVMVSPKLKVSSLPELIAMAKASPGKLNYGSAGPGSPIHLASEMFLRASGTELMHVPYKGSSAALLATMSGEVDVLLDVIPTALPHIQSGKLKALAVASAKRAQALPGVPTAAEAGLPGFEAASWNGVLAPAATPKPVIERLHREIARIMATREMREKVLELGAEAEGSRPEELAAFLRSEILKWSKVVKDANIRIE